MGAVSPGPSGCLRDAHPDGCRTEVAISSRLLVGGCLSCDPLHLSTSSSLVGDPPSSRWPLFDVLFCCQKMLEKVLCLQRARVTRSGAQDNHPTTDR